MKFDFTQKVVVVAGGGSGIGLAIARAFLQVNAKVVIAGRNHEKLEVAKSSSKEFFGPQANLHAVSANLSSQSELNRLADETISHFGSINILINSASVWSLTPIESLNDEVLDEYFNNNLKTVIYGAQMAQKYMDPGGSVVNLGSFSGLMPMRNASIYSCFKSAVITFTRSCAAELAPLGIRANCIVPGVIRTPMTSEYIDANYERVIAPIPMKRVGDVHEVADSALFLSSEFASYISGATLEITGAKFATQL